jgi:hypothetical protein
MVKYQNFVLSIMFFCMKTRPLCRFINNTPSIYLIVAFLPARQATAILTLICCRLPSYLAGVSTVHFNASQTPAIRAPPKVDLVASPNKFRTPIETKFPICVTRTTTITIQII